MIRAIDHLGIAVRSLEESLSFWAGALGLEVAGIETVDSEGVKVAMLPAGRSRIELLEPLGDDSPVAKFISGRGQGIHHLTFEVGDIEAALARLGERGIQVIGEAPRAGAEGSRVAFVHPKSTGGVLVELVEKSAGATEGGDLVPGKPVLAYLREPSEKLWGLLRRLDAAGLVIEGIDLTSFDDWIAQVERGEESIVGPSVLFLPMARIDKILLDRDSGELPSLAERFYRRTGRTVHETLGTRDPR
jgi:methylmalonyl-CoA epimerase